MARGSSTKRGGRAGSGSDGKATNGRRRDREVLDVAAKVFHSRGYADASVQDIADELGILKGSLYHYIDTKEDLLFALLVETHEEVQAILTDIVEKEKRPPLETLHEYVRRQVEYTCRNLARMSIYYHDMDQLSRPRLRELVEKRKTHETFVAGLIEQAQAEGTAAKEDDPAIAANFVFGSMIWVYRWYRPGKPPTAEVAQECADFVVRGVRSPS